MAKDEPTRPFKAAGSGDNPLDSVLVELQTVLDQQLALAQAGKTEEVLAKCETIGGLIERAGELLKHGLPNDRNRLQAIRETSRKVGLILAQQRQEASDKLSKIRRGSRSLNAYRDQMR